MSLSHQRPSSIRQIRTALLDHQLSTTVAGILFDQAIGLGRQNNREPGGFFRRRRKADMAERKTR